MGTQPTLVQPKFCDSGIYFSLEAWLDEGRYLANYEKELKDQDDALRRRKGVFQWDIGDWLLKGVDGGVKKRAFKKHALQITGYKNVGSLKNLMTISRQVPESRRHDGRQGRKFLSYAVHVEVAKFDGETQERLLEIADEGDPRLPYTELPYSESAHRPFSVRRFRQHIAFMQDLGELPKTGKEKVKKKQPGCTLKVWVSDVNHEHFCRLSLALGPTYAKRSYNSLGRSIDEPKPEDALFWCAQQYIKEHKAEVLEMIAKDQAKRAESKRIYDICDRKLPPQS